MNEKEWDQFFDLVGKIVNLTDLCAAERQELLWKEADRRASSADLDELMSYSCAESE